ncbi:MAG TPA: ATP-binding protein [Thermoanaerobaculia bacterium]|nr:ATP-binding protein [Thermoanaerobaculia bacterium]
MEWPEVQQRVAQGENEQTELKLWPGFPKKVAEAICAFANSDGGLLVLGVDDAGEIRGVDEDPEVVQEKLTSFLQTGLNAPVQARLGRELVGDSWVHWVEVRRSRGPEPFRYGSRIYVRRGRASVEPSSAELQELFNVFGFVLTEEQIVPGTTPSDLDIEVFETFLRRLGLDLEEDPRLDRLDDLRNRGVVALDDSTPRLTLYGLLCFGRQPQSFPATRSAWVQLVAYAGTDRASEAILSGEAKGRVDEQVERSLGWIKALGVREEYGPIERTDRPLVPLRALREAVVNAVVHRDYAVLGSKVLVEVFRDRIDITSPGVLPNHMTVASALAGGHPRTRNELIANYMMARGLMEVRGRGLPIIAREMREWNGTQPEMMSSTEGRFVRLTLRLDQKVS